jgi:hypothetical protein
MSERRAAAFLLLSAVCCLLSIPASAAAPVHVVTANNASCDVGTYAAATLLLPYFEVDFQRPTSQALNTVFTVINTSRTPQLVRVTVWTDLGYPVMWFPMFLTGYDMETISMYELIARGTIPVTYSGTPNGAASADNDSNPNQLQDIKCARVGGSMTPEYVHNLQRKLTTGYADTECRIGLAHKNAEGYVTIDVTNSCDLTSPMEPGYWNNTILFDNVLTGDYERINPDATTGNYAGGAPLVHIRAIPEGGGAGMPANVPMPFTFYDRYTPANAKRVDRRQPLPSLFAARYIEGGPTGFRTNLMIWREGITGATLDECEYAKNEKLAVRGIIRFDEHENPTTVASQSLTLPPTSASASNATSFPPMSSDDHGGWFWISLDNGTRPRPTQNWVTVQMYAEGRYGVDFDATWLANGCTPAVPSAP